MKQIKLKIIFKRAKIFFFSSLSGIIIYCVACTQWTVEKKRNECISIQSRMCYFESSSGGKFITPLPKSNISYNLSFQLNHRCLHIEFVLCGAAHLAACTCAIQPFHPPFFTLPAHKFFGHWTKKISCNWPIAGSVTSHHWFKVHLCKLTHF